MFRILNFSRKIISSPSSILFVKRNRKFIQNKLSYTPIRYGSSGSDGRTTVGITWRSFTITSTIGIGLVGIVAYLRHEQKEKIKLEKRKMVGKTALGGEWEGLIDSNNDQISSKDFHGKWCLLYFGFTHCPDICPEQIERLCEVVDKIEKYKDASSLIPLFVSVDPERDTPQITKEYCEEFSKKLVGLTAKSLDDISQITKLYRVYFTQGPKDETNDYIIDHAVITYLIGPNGEFVDYYGQNLTSEQMTHAIRLHMQKRK
ncbi:hypothetical protein SNEBB_004206 [Seison nebaliae]|nr:hypothetical protein SNEBB_004206 [Seison nebaliae]